MNPFLHALGRPLRPALLRLPVRELPATGRHRKFRRARHRASATPYPPTRANPSRPAHSAHRVPAQRSPYSREQTVPLDGDGSALSRPYLPAAADRAPEADPLQPPLPEAAGRTRPPRRTAAGRAVRRGRVLWVATAGLDLDTRAHHTRTARSAPNARTALAGGVR